MKRDMDLIRGLLFDIETTDSIPALKKNQAEDIYHLLLLQEAELIAGVVVVETDQGILIPQIVSRPRLTWKGHEFLDAARSDTVWNEAKKKTGDAIGSISFAVLTQLLVQLAKQHLGMTP